MLGSIRRVLAGDHYTEVNLVNAHFRLLFGNSPTTRALQSYCDGRDEHMASLLAVAGVSKAVAKQTIIMIFCGFVRTWVTKHEIAGDPVVPEIRYAVQADICACKEAFGSNPDCAKYIAAEESRTAASARP
jgi:hypothetical protein